MKAEHTLTQTFYSKDVRGPWALYVYEPNGYHTGAQWFAKVIRYPQEQISVAEARLRVIEAVSQGREVRITDAGDMLVFHSVNGAQLHPQGIDFWAAVEGCAMTDLLSEVQAPDEAISSSLEESIDRFAATANRIADQLVEAQTELIKARLNAHLWENQWQLAQKLNQEQFAALERALAALKAYDSEDQLSDTTLFEIVDQVIPMVEDVIAKAKR